MKVDKLKLQSQANGGDDDDNDGVKWLSIRHPRN